MGIALPKKAVDAPLKLAEAAAKSALRQLKDRAEFPVYGFYRGPGYQGGVEFYKANSKAGERETGLNPHEFFGVCWPNTTFEELRDNIEALIKEW